MCMWDIDSVDAMNVDIARVVLVGFFFFQAEDGIRDLVRSRGLGDVYKRQLSEVFEDGKNGYFADNTAEDMADKLTHLLASPVTVSYTHLTLPTSDLV